jgi:transposase
MARLSLGVDVAKMSIEAALWSAGRAQRLGAFANDPAGFAALAAAVAALVPADEPVALRLTLEPTGGYELALAHWAHQRGWLVGLPNPRQVRDWAAGVGRRAKTDGQDALTLARYGAERQPPPWRPLPAEIAELESLLRRRDDLEQMLRQERNRLAALGARPGVAPAVPASVERTIGLLEEEARAIEQAIRALVGRHAGIREAVTWLRSVPGVGERTALPLVVLLARWDRLTDGLGDGKGLAAFAGLDPQPHESGASVRRRAPISRMGDRAMRRRLYMGALGGVRGANALRDFYQRLVGRGKAKKLALVAAARKILLWAWAVYRRRTPFDASRAAPALALAAD